MLNVDCPTCKKKVPWTQEYPDRPFCSPRCRLIDLGAWSDESYKIPAAVPTDFIQDGELGSDPTPTGFQH
ncbi:MAG: DNA gyrase inhibitor YacG [Hahellaceae bacterium]|nr:DNA gyrase inhibitor YacG [Hahellaceae bacterium]